MKLNEVVQKAEELYELAIRHINNNQVEESRAILQTVVSLYSKCIDKKPNHIGLYYNRALAHKALNNKFPYFIDIFTSRGFKDAQSIFDNFILEDDYKIFSADNYTLIFDIIEKDIIREFSCIILNSSGRLLEKINIEIIEKYPNEDDFEVDIHALETKYTYSNIATLLLFRLKLCDIIISSDLPKNKEIIKRELKSKLFLDLIETKESISLLAMAENILDAEGHINNISDVFNRLYKQDIQNIDNAEVNTTLIIECYRELKIRNTKR